MRKIERYSLLLARQQTVSIPQGATIQCLRMESGAPALYLRIDPTKPMETANIRGFLTGEMLPDLPGYSLGTVGQLPQIWHMFMHVPGWCGYDVIE